MATVFCDFCDMVLIDYLEKGRTITGKYHAVLLDQLKDAIQSKRPYLAKKKVLFRHNNAPAHTSRVVWQT